MLSSMKKREDTWNACHECSVKLGGKLPPKFIGTVMTGRCEYCKKKSKTLIPHCDYDWPKEGRKAMWD
jgi:hypothetical protein